MEIGKDIQRILNNFSRAPSYSAIVTADQIDDLLQNHSDLIFCNGKVRRLKVDKITEKTYRIYTEDSLNG